MFYKDQQEDNVQNIATMLNGVRQILEVIIDKRYFPLIIKYPEWPIYIALM